MYSLVVKQSCVSMPCSSQQPLRCRRARKASTMARRACGSTYGAVGALGDLVVELEARGAVAPAQDARERLAAACRAGARSSAAKRGEARKTATAPSVTCEQSRDLMRPPTAALYLSRAARAPRSCTRCASAPCGLQLRVGVVHRRDVRQVLVLQPEALVVLVAQLAEELGEGELDALGLLLVPRRGAEVVAAGLGD